MPNQNPEQIARDKIDTALVRCGWIIQGKTRINLQAGVGRGSQGISNRHWSG